VRDLDDDAAYMLLATSNAQGELSPLERGMHALGSGGDLRSYAKASGREKEERSVYAEAAAARVAQAVAVNCDEFKGRFQHLVEIHSAPRWLWPALASAMLAKPWSVEQTRAQVARLKDVTADR
jgi:hypothetical protein